MSNGDVRLKLILFDQKPTIKKEKKKGEKGKQCLGSAWSGIKLYFFSHFIKALSGSRKTELSGHCISVATPWSIGNCDFILTNYPCLNLAEQYFAVQ